MREPRPYFKFELSACLLRACCIHGVLLLVFDICLCLIFALCVLNALFKFPSKFRLYQWVTFICLWVISQYLLTPKYGRAQLLPSQCLDQSEWSYWLTQPISWFSVRWQEIMMEIMEMMMMNCHLLTTALLTRGRGKKGLLIYLQKVIFWDVGHFSDKMHTSNVSIKCFSCHL